MAKSRPSAAKAAKKATKSATRSLTVNLSEDAVRAIAAAAGRAASAAPATAAAQTAAATQAAEKTARAYTSGLVQSQERLFRNAGTASNMGFGGVAQRMTRIGGMASGLHDLGFTNAAASLSKMAGPLAVAAQVAGKAVDTAKVLALAAHDNYSTNAQIGRKLVRELVPGGSWIQDKVDAFSGRAAAMEQADISGRMRGVDVQGRLAESAAALRFNPAQAGREAAAAAYRLPGAMVAPPVLDRSTAGGEQQYRDAMRLLPLRQQTVKLDREARAASAERLATEREMVRLESRRAELHRDRSRVEAQLAENQRSLFGGSGGAQQELLRRQENINQELSGVNGQRQSTAEASAAARSREVAARAEADRAKVREDLIGRAQNLQERADRAKSTAHTLGMMNPIERQQAAAIARLGQQRGIDVLPPEWKAIYAQVAPEEARMAAIRAGSSGSAFRALQESGAAGDIGRPGQSPANLQRQTDELQAQAAGREFSIDAQAAADMAAASRDLGRFFVNIIRENNRTLKEDILREIRLGRNQ